MTDRPVGANNGGQEETTGRKVILLLLLAGAAGAAAFGFLGFSPNRILSAKPIYLWQVTPGVTSAGVALGAALVVAALAISSNRWRQVAVLTGATLVFASAVAGAGAGATAALATVTSTAARVSLGGAFWTVALVSALAMTEALRRLNVHLGLRLAFAAIVAVAVSALAFGGWFDNLSLAREWANRREAYGAAFGEHLTLVGTSLGFALIIGAPIGIAAAGRPRLSRPIFTVLNLVQTIPSIALFGLLIGPLTALGDALPWLHDIGLSGIGFVPAVIALTLYGLLPIARSTEAGILSVPDAAIETARGMGMTKLQILAWVSVPLALPVLLAGLRIVTVQLIGLAVVAALIGAGGFGAFVFLGLGQTATDLVLLGALSAIAIAIVADGLLRLLTQISLRATAP